jgi:hypothetical protein
MLCQSVPFQIKHVIRFYDYRVLDLECEQFKVVKYYVIGEKKVENY